MIPAVVCIVGYLYATNKDLRGMFESVHISFEAVDKSRINAEADLNSTRSQLHMVEDFMERNKASLESSYEEVKTKFIKFQLVNISFIQ